MKLIFKRQKRGGDYDKKKAFYFITGFWVNIQRLFTSGGNTNIVLTVSEGLTLDLTGLKITKAKTSFTYGAVETRGGTVNLNDCFIYGNEAIGLLNSGGTMTVNRCSILANTKIGIQIVEGTAAIADCVIAENVQKGIRNLDGIVMVDGCTISGNSGSGAGIENSRGKMTVINTIVSENKADTWESASAGGIRNGGDLTVIDSGEGDFPDSFQPIPLQRPWHHQSCAEQKR